MSDWCDGYRLRRAAAKLRTEPALGPAAMRDAVAAWLEANAAVTGRIERITHVPTLPFVVDIVVIIEQSGAPPAANPGKVTGLSDPSPTRPA